MGVRELCQQVGHAVEGREPSQGFQFFAEGRRGQGAKLVRRCPYRISRFAVVSSTTRSRFLISACSTRFLSWSYCWSSFEDRRGPEGGALSHLTLDADLPLHAGYELLDGS